MKTKYGYMACPDCATRVVVKINEHQTLSYRCDECDGYGYAKKGEGRYSKWDARITEKTTAPAAPPAEPKSAAPTKSVAKPQESKPAAAKMPWVR